MPVNATARKYLSDLLKAADTFSEESAVRYNFATVAVQGSGDVDNIGIPLMWDEATTAFKVFAANADWAATTAYSLGDIVKATVQDGNEYVCTVAGTSGATEPTAWTTIAGGETTDGTVTWTARKAYSAATASTNPLKNGASVAVSVGSLFGVGFNKKDTTLSGTDANMTVIYRGPAALISEGFEWGAIAAADQAEFLTALEDAGITTIDNAPVVTPTFTS